MPSSYEKKKEKEVTEKRRFGRKKDVRTIFGSFDIFNELRISSQTKVVAVAVNAIIGISNFKKSNFLALKFSLSADIRLKCQKNMYIYSKVTTLPILESKGKKGNL